MNIHAQAQIITATQPYFMPVQSAFLQRKCACGQHTIAGGECEECHQKREGTLQRAAVSVAPTNTVPPIVHDVLSSPGQPLDAGTRAFMEPRFGHDFSRVRVHTDARAAESARSVNALAYTVGRNMVFGTGQYAQGTSEGRRLLAHELTHTIQQSHALRTKADLLQVSTVGDEYENEADHMARVINHDVQGAGQIEQHIRTVGHPMIQRDEASNPLRMRIPPTPDLRYHPPQSTETPITPVPPKKRKTPITLGLFEPLPKSAVEAVAQSSFPDFKIKMPTVDFAGGSRLSLYFLGFKIQNPSKESVRVGTEGVTIGTGRGSLGVGFDGKISITKTDGPVKLAASISKDHWEVNLSYPLTTSAPFIDNLQNIFTGLNQFIVDTTDGIIHFRDFGTAKNRIGSKTALLFPAIKAIEGISATPAGPSFGISISGGIGGKSGQEGFGIHATFTYRFGQGDKPDQHPSSPSMKPQQDIGRFSTSGIAEIIAAQAEGPDFDDFETEIPGQGAEVNFRRYLPEIINTIIKQMLEASSPQPSVVEIHIRLGNLPIHLPVPPSLTKGFQRIADAIVAVDPTIMGGFKGIRFYFYQNRKVEPWGKKEVKGSKASGESVTQIYIRPRTTQ